MVWPCGFKYTNGFTKHWWAIAGTMLMMLVSFGLMALASKTLHVGTVYAVWTGMGAAGIAVIGMFLLDEPKDLARIVCIGLIVVGAVGLKFWGSKSTELDNEKPDTQQASVQK
jgi:quaternary ammonium compound-resistance protein SugE